ncbi:IS110 family transposase [Massilia sp. Mn16-1_5]|uniref:IS110 family transposase n=1 Tax=Massilia sp. Mn16-1_5 TaxID=2079199 RepID=UPI00109E6DB3|nr:IS110 family transposase [Massilia sp. Mn16-1_5]THC46642.1 IS110 family transposase [Massilia sp. Mn16-1_5]
MKYLGVDVSKDKLDCCLLRDAADTKRKTKVVANSPAGLATLAYFVEKEGILPDELHVIMEGTGVYHQLAAETLSDAGMTVSIANPAQVKDFGRGMAVRTKNDTKDSFVLARYGALLKPAPWVPPPPAARQLQAYIAREDAIKKDIEREQNRKEKSVVGRAPADVLASIDETIGFLNTQLKAIRKKIDAHIDRHPDLKDDMKLLTSIPGVGPETGHHMLSVMHTHQFHSAEQLAAYLGLVPVERQSGTSLHARPKLSKAGPKRMRAALYMPAVSALQWNPHIRALKERLAAKGKTPMAIVGAAMRKLVHLCFGVLRTRTKYSPDHAHPA